MATTLATKPNPKTELKSKYRRIKNVGTCLLIAGSLLTGCSNPFSGSKTERPPNYHTPNPDCNRIDLSLGILTASQLRSITECLNAAHEIESFSLLIQSLSDSDLEPFIEVFNQTAQKNPQVLYALKNTYLKFQKDGLLRQFEKSMHSLFLDPIRNQKIASILKAINPDLRKLMLQKKLEWNTRNLHVLISSASFQRLTTELSDQNNRARFGASLKDYLESADAVSLEALQAMLLESSIATEWKVLFNKNRGKPSTDRLQKLAAFFEWMFENDRFSSFSSALKNIQEKPLSCFQGSKRVNPIPINITQLGNMSPEKAKLYFKHDLKNLAFAAQGYCKISYSVNPILRFLSESADQVGFEEAFSLIRTLLKNQSSSDHLLRLFTSQAARQWVSQNNFLREKNFFLDAFTFVSLYLNYPLLNDEKTFATFLDSMVHRLSHQQLQDLFELLSPGTELSQAIFQGNAEFPKVTFSYPKPPLETLDPLLSRVFASPLLGDLFTLADSLIQKNQFQTITDQTLAIFKDFIDRGKHTVVFGEALFPHFSETDLYFALLSKVPPSSPPDADHVCASINYDWDFTQFMSQNAQAYQTQMDLIQKCIDPNQTFKSAQDFFKYASKAGTYSVVLKTQKNIFDHLFQMNSHLLLSTASHFLEITSAQSKLIERVILASTSVFSEIKEPLKNATLFRKFLGEQIQNQDLILGLHELRRAARPPQRPRIERNFNSIPKIDVLVEKNVRFSQIVWPEAVKKIMLEYCPSLNAESKDCEIEEDQVRVYLSSPSQLVQQIQEEYLSSIQSWIHPLQFKGWGHERKKPKTVSEINFQLFPLQHLIRKNRRSTQAVFNVFPQVKKDHLDFTSFFRDRSAQFLLIPYFFHVAHYPEKTNREFHDRIRIRVLSQLDRLELIAIDADFKAPVIKQNMGMGFIRDIGLAWGDEPKQNRPASLNEILNGASPATLKQTADAIHRTLDKFDTALIERLGGLGPQLFDIRARIFNLRFLISLLDEELPPEDGGKNGLKVLRDIFYSLYAGTANTEQRNHFPNGNSLPQVCTENPIETQDKGQCSFDYLTIISRLTRLGAIHQIGMYLFTDPDSSLPELLSILDRISVDSVVANRIIEFSQTQSAVKLSQSLEDFVIHSESNVLEGVSPLVRLISQLKSFRSLGELITLFETYPTATSDFQPLLDLLLDHGSESIRFLDHFTRAQPESHFKKWIDSLSNNPHRNLMLELSSSLQSLSPRVKILTENASQLIELPALNAPALNSALDAWLLELAETKNKPVLTKISTWINQNEFNEFCNAFSDQKTIEKAYRFLESIHQNPDSKIFVHRCEAYFY